MKTNYILSYVVFAIVISFFTACEYEFVEPKKPVPIVPPGDTISFSLNIVPLWNNGNKCTSCHGDGGTAPNLTPDNAYSSLTSLGLIDQATPENSVIYDYPSPASSTHNWKKYSVDEAAAILLWIKEGAKNN